MGRHYSRFFGWALKKIDADPDKFEEDGSRWPKSRQQFMWDLAPEKLAPNRDGLVPPPTGDKLAWAADVTDDEEVQRMYDTARTFRKDADETTRGLELKAARLATVLVALVTANVALVVYEITRLGPDPSAGLAWLVGIGVTFGLLGAIWLLVGLIRAVDADQRMGMTYRATLDDVAHDRRQAMLDEADGYRISDWTRLNKANRLLDARAAVSRSMVCLVISTAFAVALAFTTTLNDDPSSTGKGHPDHGRHHHQKHPGPGHSHPSVRPPTPQVPTGTPTHARPTRKMLGGSASGQDTSCTFT